MSIEPQTELFSQPRHAPNADVEWFENLLKSAAHWMTAAQILQRLDRPADEDGKRWVKALAAETVWVIAGQKGYRHIEHATAEEIDHACHRLESIAKTCGDRAGKIRANAHRIFG